MKVQDAVRKMTLVIGIGTAALSCLMVLVFVLVGKFDGTVIAGAVLGTAAATLNFFLMGLSVQKAAAQMTPAEQEADEEQAAEEEKDSSTGTPKKPLSDEGKQVKKQMQLNYTLRMLMLVVVAILAVCLPVFHPIATVLPFLFPRLVISIRGLVIKEEA